MPKLDALKQHFPQSGRVEWIGIRKDRGVAITELNSVEAVAEHGLKGDKAGMHPRGKRQITLIQAEYIPVIQALLANSDISPARLRRNISISGINLNALKDQIIQVGAATLEITGFCHPCHKLEDQLGFGALNALRGHGGLTAKVISGGDISVGDVVHVITD